jgi:hypothetical protein
MYSRLLKILKFQAHCGVKYINNAVGLSRAVGYFLSKQVA